MFKSGKAFSSFAVDDVGKAKDFYGRILGLDVAESDGMLTLQTGGGSDVLVYSKPDHEPATFTVLNLPVESVDRAIEELTGQGVQFEIYHGNGIETDDRGVFVGDGPRIAWFKDPAGNILSVIEEA
jgi:catechol 2,3-dioxygenase-like lactoylglutathione lyase family enzyme